MGRVLHNDYRRRSFVLRDDRYLLYVMMGWKMAIEAFWKVSRVSWGDSTRRIGTLHPHFIHYSFSISSLSPDTLALYPPSYPVVHRRGFPSSPNPPSFPPQLHQHQSLSIYHPSIPFPNTQVINQTSRRILPSPIPLPPYIHPSIIHSFIQPVLSYSLKYFQTPSPFRTSTLLGA